MIEELIRGSLSATTQALGDRVGTKDPQFGRIGPGFSADAILMAAIDGELAQIVKLSTSDKLSSERRTYQRFVRYRIPFAARVPALGYSVDSSGVKGMEAGRKSGRADAIDHGASILLDKASFGALVSDLVDGFGTVHTMPGVVRPPRVETLLSLIAKPVERNTESDKTDILRAIS